MNAIKSAWDAAQGWRTLAFNLMVAVLGVLEAFDLTRIIESPQAAGVAALVIASVNALLRVQTSTPVGAKPE
jgi:hypothetical protein